VAWWSLGGAEVLTGLLVLALPAQRWAPSLAALLLAGAVAYTFWALRIAPDRPCGCFGAASSAPVSRWTLVRAMVLTATATTAAVSSDLWWRALTAPWVWGATLLEALLIAGLSPEAHQAVSQLAKAHAPRSPMLPRSLEQDLLQLQASQAWQTLSPYLTSQEVLSHWRQGLWRFVCFPAHYAHHEATAIFAVVGDGTQSRSLGSLVDETEQQVLLAADGTSTCYADDAAGSYHETAGGDREGSIVPASREVASSGE